METQKTRGVMTDQHDYSLLRHNTFGIEAHCARFLEYASEEEACQIASLLKDHTEPLLILGGGSNLLLTADFPGTVVHSAVKGFDVVQEDDDTIVLRVGSGELWDDVVARCVSNGWYGTENLSLIPGEAGASAVQNIGAYGAEAATIINKVEAVSLADGHVCTFDAADCQYGYRQSRFKHEWKNRYLITHVCYRLSKTFRPLLDYGNIRSELERQGISDPTAAQLREVIIGIRREKLPDPEVEGNAGSFFMNPIVECGTYDRLCQQWPNMPHYRLADGRVKIPAGWMIDQCGWKGRSLGPAGVHDKQALVLVNLGGASGQDILRLCQRIQHDVKEKFGIDIQPEVNIR